MKNLFLIINIIISVLLILFIIIQGRGAGIGSAWGGGGEFFQTRRGIEKWTLRLTVFLVIIFFFFTLFDLLY